MIKSAALTLLLVGANYSPRVLVIQWADNTPPTHIAATSPATCNDAIAALYACVGDLPSCDPSRRKWPQDHPIKSAACEPGNLFSPAEMCIDGFNCPSTRER